MSDVDEYLMALAHGTIYSDRSPDERFLIGHSLGLMLGISSGLRVSGAPRAVIDEVLSKAAKLSPLFGVAHKDATTRGWVHLEQAPGPLIH